MHTWDTIPLRLALGGLCRHAQPLPLANLVLTRFLIKIQIILDRRRREEQPSLSVDRLLILLLPLAPRFLPKERFKTKGQPLQPLSLGLLGFSERLRIESNLSIRFDSAVPFPEPKGSAIPLFPEEMPEMPESLDERSQRYPGISGISSGRKGKESLGSLVESNREIRFDSEYAKNPSNPRDKGRKGGIRGLGEE